MMSCLSIPLTPDVPFSPSASHNRGSGITHLHTHTYIPHTHTTHTTHNNRDRKVLSRRKMTTGNIKQDGRILGIIRDK